jgi:putative RNA 2'-phosphotransferase
MAHERAKNLKKISKRCSYVLRHRPDIIDASVDDHGWMLVSELLMGLGIDRDCLDETVDKNDKQRFEYNEKGDKIRARQGHSLPVVLDYEPLKPPDVLYHGTAYKLLSLIYKDGIKKMNRHHVHLCYDTKTATKVGQRHGKPVVLAIKAGKMFDDGYLFYVTGNNVWLTDHVPPDMFEIHQD